MIRVGFFLLLSIGVLSRVLSSAACKNVEAVQNFNASQFMGTWYEVQKFFSSPGFEGKCVIVKYTPNSDSSIKVTHGRVDAEMRASIEGKITYVGKKSEAKFIVTFPGKSPNTYSILNIDYKKYFVLFSCVNGANDVWIFARKRKLPASFLKKAVKFLDKYKLNSKLLVKTDQKNCPVIPSKL